MVLSEKKLLALIDEAELHQALRDVTSLCERGKPRTSWDYSDRHVEGASVDRARVWIVLTTWGGPMSPGSKAYDYLDYDKSPTNYFQAYIPGISSQLRSWNMGSFYWIGLRDGDWYSMTTKSGSGGKITLSIPNQSGDNA